MRVTEAGNKTDNKIGNHKMFVGVLHSLSGPWAMREKPLVDATLMAIAEINENGGILGKQIQPIVEDGGSDPVQFKQKARKLLNKYRIKMVFGCSTSASRKAILPIFEASNALLWYSSQYEGLEQSRNIFYTGFCLNQQIEPTVVWLLKQEWKRFYLLGSDYIFPLAANKVIKGQLNKQGGKVVGEHYVPPGDMEFEDIIADILEVQPDIILSTLNGSSNIYFYQQYKAANAGLLTIPIMALSVEEETVQHIGEAAIGHYACWSYFQSLNTPENQEFVQNFQHRYGASRVTTDPIVSAYTQVYLWRQAVQSADSFEVDRVRSAAYGQIFLSPSGWVKLDPNHHLWRGHRIGKVVPGGQFQVLESQADLLKPLPWLGVEELSFDNASVVINVLSEISHNMQYSWQLEKHSHQLEGTLRHLQHEIRQRQQVEIALQQANKVLEIRVQERTAELQEKTEHLEQALEELQSAQIQLIHTEKMSSLGQLVAGVAHEINNPVNFIYGNVLHINGYAKDLLQLVDMYQQVYVNPDPRIQDIIDAIDLGFLVEDLPKIVNSLRMGSERIREIVQSLRTFSRLDEADVKAVDIHEGIDSTLTILRSRLKAKPGLSEIKVVKNYGKLPKVECYSGQLNQVFMNILVNAIDALEERDYQRDRADLDANPSQITIQTQMLEDQVNVVICIRDNGPGIPEEIRGKLFDPFFTTKEIGKGTGLGLAISHQIVVERHRGILQCFSESGKGTEFSIQIPLHQGTS